MEDLQKDVGKIGKEIEEAATVKEFGTWANPSAGKPKPTQPGPKPVEAPQTPEPPSEAAPPPTIESDQESNQNA